MTPRVRQTEGSWVTRDRALRLSAFVVVCLCFANATLGATTVASAAQRLNVLLLVIDDVRWDSIGVAGNQIVHTPRIDQLAREGIRFREARVTTSICMVSRATLLTGQYMSRHRITTFGAPLSPAAFANTYPAVLRRAGYWTGHVGKYDVGDPRASDYDYLRAYQGRHWIGDGGDRVHVTQRNARDSIEFLHTRPNDRPFVLSVGFFAPHAQDDAPEQYLPQEWSAREYAGVTVPPPLRGDSKHLKALPPFLASESNEGRVRYHKRFDTPERYQDSMIRYYRMITEVDAVIGELLDELKTEGVYENTLIVFIGDNGYFQADRGLADKWYPYEESVRVPLIVRDPRLPAVRRGLTLDALALNLDVAPTIVSAAGATVPDAMQGRDLSRLYLYEKPRTWRDEFFYEHPTVTSRDRIPSSQGVIRRDWKFIDWPEWGYRQLFDLKHDPGEIRNLIDSAAYAARLKTMRAKLDAWRERAR